VSLYYQDDLVTLYHGDCLLETDWLQADALVTDPPYGIAYKSNQRRSVLARSIQNDESTAVRDKALEMWGNEKAALIFGSWRKPRPEATRMLLVWDTKGALGMGDLTIPWKPAHQEIYVVNRKGFTGKRTTDVLTFAPVQSMSRNGRMHPHQKPVPLLEELISKTVGTIADPFAGVGSTLVAAANLGRPIIGFEMEEMYCEKAANRLSERKAA
jgi:site-specific DNA-methyltransferase (adenine-specific)